VAINPPGVGLIMPVMPILLLKMDVPTLSEAAAVGGMLSLVFAAMQFLFVPLLGRVDPRDPKASGRDADGDPWPSLNAAAFIGVGTVSPFTLYPTG